MTKDKAQKRATRARMSKTGESYTAARRHTVGPKERLDPEVLGQTDASMRKNTGKGWREWLRILDAWGANGRKHGEITRYLAEEYGVPGWWCQSITVGYERVRGMRAKYQRVSGVFAVSVSKTYAFGVGKLFSSFTDARERNRWLDRGTLRARTSQKNKTARFDFRDDGSRVHAYFESKGRAKTTVSIEHEKLADAGAVEEMRTFWKDHLTHLAKLLKG
ncbi:MAG: DUF4287 domain-containing protein [Actinomycetota bacterium]